MKFEIQGFFYFSFFKYLLFIILFIISFIFFYIPDMELIGLFLSYFLQILISVYIIRDMYYLSENGNDFMGNYIIILPIIISFISMSFIIFGVGQNNDFKNDLSSNSRSQLTIFKFLYIIEFLFLIVIIFMFFMRKSGTYFFDVYFSKEESVNDTLLILIKYVYSFVILALSGYLSFLSYNFGVYNK